jgi:hypothetical protein
MPGSIEAILGFVKYPEIGITVGESMACFHLEENRLLVVLKLVNDFRFDLLKTSKICQWQFCY